MSELSPEAKRLMEIARDAYSPPEQRTSAVRDALYARLASSRDESELLRRMGGAGASGLRGLRGLRLVHWVGIGLFAGAFVTGAVFFGGRKSRETEAVALPPLPPTAAAAAPVTEPTPALASKPVEPPQPSAAERTRTARTDDQDDSNGAARRTAGTRPAARAAHGNGAERARGAQLSKAGTTLAAQPRTGAARANLAARAQPTAAEASAAAEASPSAANTRAAQTADDAASTVSGSAPVASAAVTDAREPPRATRMTTAVEPVPTKAPSVDDSLSRELALLRRANRALKSRDGREAIAAADEHETQFPNGRLRQERMAVRALALCMLGRVEQARAVAAALESIAPRSPHLARIHASCSDTASQPK